MSVSDASRLVLTTIPSAFTGRGFLASLDGNGNVGFGDILEVLSNWGGGGPDGDANQDGIVDFQDLLAILGALGPCP